MSVNVPAIIKQKNNNAKLSDSPIDRNTDKLPKKTLKKSVMAIPIIAQASAPNVNSGCILAIRPIKAVSSSEKCLGGLFSESLIAPI